MKLNLIQKTDCDIEIVFIKDKKLKEDKAQLQLLGFKGENESCIILPHKKKLYVGCETKELEDIKIACATAIQKLSSTNFKTINIDASDNLSAIIEGLMLGDYKFSKYKSKKDKKDKKTINLIVPKITKKLQAIFDESIKICDGINLVRDIINTAPDDFYPQSFVKEAKSLAKEYNLECKIFDDKYFKDKNMGAIQAVARASRHKPKLIHLTYKPKIQRKKLY